MSNFRNAIFVDAGYVFGQGGVSLSGATIPRPQLQLNEAEIVNQLKSIAVAGGMPLLRIYWYDGARTGMTLEQSTLADMPDVKVRLGSINSAGQQKGVDSLLVTDLIDLARNQAIADAYIVTGINLEPAGVSLNPQLRQEADTVHEIPKVDVAKFLQTKVPPTPVLSISASAQGVVTLDSAAKQAIKTVFSTMSPADLQKMKTAASPASGIPAEYDRKVLGTCRSLLGRELTSDERRKMRDLILDWLKQQ